MTEPVTIEDVVHAYAQDELMLLARSFVETLSWLNDENRPGWWAYLLEAAEAEFDADELDTIRGLLDERREKGGW